MKNCNSKLLFGVLLDNNNNLVSVANNLKSTINKSIHFFSIELKQQYQSEYIVYFVWFSCQEERWFRINQIIDLKNPIDSLIVGVLPNTEVGIWAVSEEKSYILGFVRGEDVSNIVNSIHKDKDFCLEWSICDNEYTGQQHLLEFQQNIKQYNYRYNIVFDNWDEDMPKWQICKSLEYTMVLTSIEESLFDGTHDKLHDGGLMKYHEAGKPKKLALKWHIRKSDYSAYFWFEEEEICAIFNKFYGQHPDTKTDFIIHIDPINRKYELSLYRYGLKEPLIIPEKAYQLIVFKSGFENYRSENYNQPAGAWIW